MQTEPSREQIEPTEHIRPKRQTEANINYWSDPQQNSYYLVLVKQANKTFRFVPDFFDFFDLNFLYI